MIINIYEQAMSAQYLVLLGATNLRKSKKKSTECVNSPQVNKERKLHAHLLVESFCIVFQKYILRQRFRVSVVPKLFLIFHQISGLCSYKMVPIKKV